MFAEYEVFTATLRLRYAFRITTLPEGKTSESCATIFLEGELEAPTIIQTYLHANTM